MNQIIVCNIHLRLQKSNTKMPDRHFQSASQDHHNLLRHTFRGDGQYKWDFQVGGDAAGSDRPASMRTFHSTSVNNIDTESWNRVRDKPIEELLSPITVPCYRACRKFI